MHDISKGSMCVTVMVKQERQKKISYLKQCLKMQRKFTASVYLVDGMAAEEVWSEDKQLECLLANKGYRGYL